MTAHPEWLQLAVYAVVAAVVLTLLFSIPKVGAVLRGAASLAALALVLFVVLQQAPLRPGLSQLMAKVGLDGQTVAGDTVSIRMSPDGHFWADVEINGVSQPMLIDSGATVTTISDRTARATAVEGDDLLPVVLQTAGGMIAARTGEIDHLTLGTIEARKLKVVVAPTGGIDVLGMNFLSNLAGWRVEGRTLILVPEPVRARPPPPAAPPSGSPGPRPGS